MFVLPTFNLGVVATGADGPYNIEDRDTEANIIASGSEPTNPSGEVTIKYGTDTSDLYIYDGTDWYKFSND
jgi:hypothetical protein